ncbi:MAG: DUF1573 domain-containing protein [Candidatus Omnitrophica bacterium]|nr:DUF1573 domain-containing protein [Candidatus Omnitrophota bacterium]
MKTLLIVFTLIFSLLQPLICAEPVPQKQQETQNGPNIWDFGRIKEGEMAKHEFIFKNDAGKKLLIRDVSTSCGCTASKIKDKELPPDFSTTIDVQFNSKGYNGPVQQFVYVTTDNIDKPVIRFIIKAEVIK